MKRTEKIPIYKFSSIKPRHDLVLSLTTSPQRLSGLYEILNPFTVPILLNLPRKFRNKDEYSLEDIDTLQKKLPNLVVNWIENDMGPQTKLLGSLFHYRALSADGIIVIDDDTLYNDIVTEYDQNFDQFKNTVMTGNAMRIMGIDIAQGFSSYCIKPSEIDIPKLFKLMSKFDLCSKSCSKHDDMVFGASFQDLGLKIKKILSIEVFQLDVGFGSDALHNLEHNLVKHVKCGRAIWDEREQCHDEARVLGSWETIISNIVTF